MDGIIDSMDMNLSKLQEIVKDREVWQATVYEVQRVRHDLATTTSLVKEEITKEIRKYLELSISKIVECR